MSRIEPEVEGIDFPDEADQVFTSDAAREVVREKLVELKVHGAHDATDSELVSAANAHYYGGLDALLADKADEIEKRLGYSRSQVL